MSERRPAAGGIRPCATPMLAALMKFNSMPEAESVRTLQTVCGSRRWAEAMSAARPYANPTAILAEADRVWFALSREDWLEAFAHHPRIGERDLTQAKFASTAEQSSREQSGMAGASDKVRAEFAGGNAEYEAKFGHVFLICATGKSGQEMLDRLRSRLRNGAAEELLNAAKEQAMITRLRLERMLSP